ncbi:MAG: esterase-like activity of phytase family protein, partial [Bauldia sp.]|nr:esterase-like activity of phytase family protein [Bauldia sp.]
DSVAISPDGAFIAVVIENERDEEVNDGAIPQLPSGSLAILPLAAGAPDCAALEFADLTGIAEIAPTDAEPEFVSINADNVAVVTLQENNHIALVDLATAAVVGHFSAGSVDLAGIDTEENGIIDLTGSADGRLREPDGVKWLDTGRFVTANEGDLDGGSRGFTIFNADGSVAYEAGASVDQLAVRLGHYPEHRDSKGVEPEGIEIGAFGGDSLIFVGTERASLVAIYKDTGSEPEYLQSLTGGIGPEGLLAIPERGLFVTASETDLRGDGLVGSVVTLYQWQDAPAAYPTIVSADGADGLPIAWSALSAAAADPEEAGKLHVVVDSAWAEGRILTLDATQTPAVITASLTVTKDGAPAGALDLEGIAVASDGGFWLASEGDPTLDQPTFSTLIKVSAAGVIEQEIPLPESVAAISTRSGYEGVAVTGEGANETIWLAVQREWGDDPKGLVKLLAYKPADGSWGVVHYPLEAPTTGWVGLSEVSAYNGGLLFIERDNLSARDAALKAITYVSLEGVTPAPIGSAEIPVVQKTIVHDLIAELSATGGYVLEKVESLTVDAAGNAFVITDNDGVDDHSGETQLLRLGTLNLPM